MSSKNTHRHSWGRVHMVSMHVSVHVLCEKCFHKVTESTPAALVWLLNFFFTLKWGGKYQDQLWGVLQCISFILCLLWYKLMWRVTCPNLSVPGTEQCIWHWPYYNLMSFKCLIISSLKWNFNFWVGEKRIPVKGLREETQLKQKSILLFTSVGYNPQIYILIFFSPLSLK